MVLYSVKMDAGQFKHQNLKKAKLAGRKGTGKLLSVGEKMDFFACAIREKNLAF